MTLRLKLLIENDEGLSRWEQCTITDLKSPVAKHPLWKKTMQLLGEGLAAQLDISNEL